MNALTGTSFVYHPTILPGFVATWTGPRYYYLSPSELYASGTVVHVAADLATRMGASQITLLGCDFCYPGGQSHVESSPHRHEIESRPTLVETVDGNGDPVYTDFGLAQFHRHLEDYIAQQGNTVKWRKRGRGGVAMRGVDWDDQRDSRVT